MNAREFLIKLLDDGTGDKVVAACRQYVKQHGSFCGKNIKEQMVCSGNNWVAMTFSALPNEISNLMPNDNVAYGGDESGIAAILAAKAAFNLLGGRVVLRDVATKRMILPWAGCSFK